MMNMLITRDRLATLTQRIKNSQILKMNSKNKFLSGAGIEQVIWV